MKKQLTATELAYIAGLFDGEGSVSIGKSIRGYAIRVEFSVTYAPILEVMRDTFGGTIMVPKKIIHHKQYYHWIIGGRDSHNFILAILPYLHEKKPQALLADRYCKEVGIGSTAHRLRSEKTQQEWYYKELRRLKTIEHAPGSLPATTTTIESKGMEQLRLVE